MYVFDMSNQGLFFLYAFFEIVLIIELRSNNKSTPDVTDLIC